VSSRILVVEDDAAIRRGLEINLSVEGFEVVGAADGAAALLALKNQVYDIIVLDIMMPYINGFEVCERLRASGSETPIIMLSAKSAEGDIVMGLDLGADDYVTKPFRISELIARIRAHLRRRAPPAVYQFGDNEVDLENHTVKHAGEAVEMTAKEFELLRLFLDREGRVLTRDSILDAVWGHGYFGTSRTVDNFVQRLRAKLDRPEEPEHFVTVRGIGYRFVGSND
jgi:two-component system, OmpR family, alkaline phosphatase synthesis response regulator PhoP